VNKHHDMAGRKIRGHDHPSHNRRVQLAKKYRPAAGWHDFILDITVH